MSLPFAKHGFKDLPSQEETLAYAHGQFPQYGYMEVECGFDMLYNAVWCVNMWKDEQGKLDGYKPLHTETYKNFDYTVGGE